MINAHRKALVILFIVMLTAASCITVSAEPVVIKDKEKGIGVETEERDRSLQDGTLIYSMTPVYPEDFDEGTYDVDALSHADLPNMKHDKCACHEHGVDSKDALEEVAYGDMSFNRMLDATEDIIADALVRMAAGDVEPRPAYADACRYCPVAHCTKRGA